MDYKLAWRAGRKPRQEGNDGPSEQTMHPGRYAVCKICRLRIRDGQPRTWSTDPHRPGLIHASCSERS